MRRKIYQTPEQLVLRADFPHTRKHREDTRLQWKSREGFRRLTGRVTKLRALGLDDGDIACLFTDLYWDAFEEFGRNKTYGEYPSPDRH